MTRTLALLLCLLAPLAWAEKTLPTNTATVLAVGPFVDKTDGVTPETALTVTSITCELYTESDAGSAPTRTAITLAASGTSNDMTHIASDVAGFYSVEITAAQLNFLGRATLSFTYAAEALPVYVQLHVVPAQVYNSTVGGTDYLQVDVTDWKNATAPANTGDSFARLGAPAGASTASDIAAAKVDTAAIKAKTDNLPSSPAAVGSAMTLATGAVTAAAVATNAIDADAVATDAVTEIQSGLATSTALSTVGGYVDTEVGAIKAKTDNLPASPAATGDAMTLSAAYDAAKTAASQASVDAVDDYVDTEVAAIAAVTAKLDTGLESDGGVYRWTANALEQAPSGGGGLDLGASLVGWDDPNTVGLALNRVLTNLDAPISSAGGVSPTAVVHNFYSRGPGGAILPNVRVVVTYDSAGQNRAVEFVTDTLGFKAIWLEPGTYYSFWYASGYSVKGPITEVFE